MSRIKQIVAREILDSRGFPTVEADVMLTSGATGRAAVPSGASTGKHEALELRDGDATRFKGKGVRLAIQQIQQTIAPTVLRKPLPNHRVLDKILVKLETDREGRKLGANAILSISLAFERAQAAEAKQELFFHLGGKQARTLPVPLFNVINGGAHANNGLDIQEFMLVPAGAATFSEAVRMGSEVFHELKGILAQRGQPTSVGDEGGFAPKLRSNREALDLLLLAIQGAGYKAGQDIYLALDVAASEFASDTHYKFEGQSLRASDLTAYYKSLVHAYPLISIEDPLAEDDWEGWAELTKTLGGRVQIVGDDLFVTQTDRLSQGIEESVANAILIKPNQVGNLSGTLDAIRMAQRSSYGTIISHRSGETEDTFIADLAVATRAGQIKTGSLSRSERLAKYNRLLRIEEMLGKRAQFAGLSAVKAKVASPPA